jgi:hypothetical protein
MGNSQDIQGMAKRSRFVVLRIVRTFVEFGRAIRGAWELGDFSFANFRLKNCSLYMYI